MRRREGERGVEERRGGRREGIVHGGEGERKWPIEKGEGRGERAMEGEMARAGGGDHVLGAGRHSG